MTFNFSVKIYGKASKEGLFREMDVSSELEYHGADHYAETELGTILHRIEIGCGRLFRPRIRASLLEVARMSDEYWTIRTHGIVSLECGLCSVHNKHQHLENDIFVLHRDSATEFWTLMCWEMYRNLDMRHVKPYKFGPVSLTLEESCVSPPLDLVQGGMECQKEQQKFCFGDRDDAWYPMRRVNLIRSFLGTGKTFRIAELIARWTLLEGLPPRVLVLSPRRIFAEDMTKRLEKELKKRLPGWWETFPSFRCYLEWNLDQQLKETQPMKDYPRLVIQVESLWKLGLRVDYDFVIMDECESVISQMCSFETHQSNIFKNLGVLKELLTLRKAKIVMCDAFLGKNTWNLVQNLFRDCLNDVTFHHNENSRSKTSLVMLESTNVWMTKAKELLMKQQKIFMVWSSKKKLLTFAKSLISDKVLTETACVIYSSSEYHLVVPASVVQALPDNYRTKLKRVSDDGKGGSSVWKINVSDTVQDISMWWKLDCIRLVACSPSITVGLDFPDADFDATFVLTSHSKSCSVRDAVQAHLRVRKNKSDTVYAVEPEDGIRDDEKLDLSYHSALLNETAQRNATLYDPWKNVPGLPEWFVPLVEWNERRKVVQTGWHAELFFRYFIDECKYALVDDVQIDAKPVKLARKKERFLLVPSIEGEKLRAMKGRFEKLTDMQRLDLNRFEFWSEFKSSVPIDVLSEIWDKYIDDRGADDDSDWLKQQLAPVDAFVYVARIERKYKSVREFVYDYGQRSSPYTLNGHIVAMFQMVLLLIEWIGIPNSQTKKQINVVATLVPHLPELKIAFFNKDGWSVRGGRVAKASSGDSEIFLCLKKKGVLDLGKISDVDAFEKHYKTDVKQASFLVSSLFTRWCRMRLDNKGELCPFSSYPSFFPYLKDPNEATNATAASAQQQRDSVIPAAPRKQPERFAVGKGKIEWTKKIII